MVGVIYIGVGLVLCAALFFGWYLLSRTILQYIRRTYPEQMLDLPNSLFGGEGWNSPETKLIRAILSRKSIYHYDQHMRFFRFLLIGYFILCVCVGVAYVLYPIFA